MKDSDLSSLKENDVHYEKIVAALNERFKCEWDDPVHDSYAQYVKQLQEYSKEVKTIRRKAEALVEEVEGLKVDELKRKADALCEEAGSV